MSFMVELNFLVTCGILIILPAGGISVQQDGTNPHKKNNPLKVSIVKKGIGGRLMDLSKGLEKTLAWIWVSVNTHFAAMFDGSVGLITTALRKKVKIQKNPENVIV